MRLVVVAAVGGNHGPARVGSFDGAKNLLKAEDATEQFWSDADLRQERSFQLPAADASGSREPIDGDLAGAADDFGGNRRQPGIALGRGGVPHQPALHDADFFGKRRRLGGAGQQAALKMPVEVV